MTVRSATRTLDLLELLAQQTRALTLAELNRMIGLPKSSTLLLLRTLEARGYAVREAEGYRLIRLPGEVSAVQPGEQAAWGTLRRLATPALAEAVAVAKESAFLAVLTPANRVRYLSKLLPPGQELKYDRDINQDRIPHHVASGLALLAALPGQDIEHYLCTLAPDDPEPRQTADRAIRTAQRNGIAVNLKGRMEGAAGVAVAVLDPAGHAIAAVNLAGPADRVRANLPALERAARAAAAQIAHELGRLIPRHRPPATGPEHLSAETAP
ncbi:MAG: helix-turn-helix domain-containing protein [Janthinobacterium lividum]